MKNMLICTKIYQMNLVSYLVKAAFQDVAQWNAESVQEVMDIFHKLSMHLPLHYEFLVKEQFKK